MSRIGILTFHSANNFGALLQAVSLQKTIIEHGGTECELINYEPEFIYKDYSISPFKSKHPKVIIKSILRIPDKIKRNSKFQSFREENTICSGQCQSEDSFEKTCNSFEKIIVGSDQVWNYNLTEHDMHYFLPEIDDSVEKIAYAASTGGADFSTDESNEMIQCLQRFKNISVNKTVHMKIRKPIIIGSVLIGGMLIGTYYCGNRMIQFAALCITAVYAVLTNVDMLKSGVNLVKSRLGK